MNIKSYTAPIAAGLLVILVGAGVAKGQGCPGSYPPPAPPYEPGGALDPIPGGRPAPQPTPTPGETDPPRPSPPTPRITPSPGTTPETTPSPGITPSPRTTGGATPSRRRKASARQNLGKWEYWWDLNKDAYLWKARRGLETEDKSYTLGDSDSGESDIATLSWQDNGTLESIERMLPVLSKGLEESPCGPRVSAILSLGRIRHPSALRLILGALRDDCEEARSFAILALGAHGDPIVVPMLGDILRDSRHGRRIVGHDRIGVRLRALAAVALGLSGQEKASLPLREALKYEGTETEIARSAAVAIGVLGDSHAIPQLLDAVRDSSVDRVVRAHALAALGPLNDRSALPIVAEHLKKGVAKDLLRSAVLAAGRLATPEDEGIVRSLNRIALEGRDPLASSWALISLGQIGGTEARKTLLRSLVSKSSQTRGMFAALGLGVLYFDGSGSPRDRVRDTLRIRGAYLDANNESTRGCLAIALGLMDDHGSIELLTNLLYAKGSPELKGHAAEALGLLRAEMAVPAITAFLWQKGQPALSQRAARSLSLVATKQTVQAIQKQLSESKRGIDSRGVSLSLGMIGDATCVGSLCDLALTSPQASEREVAFYAMGLWADRVHSPDRVPNLYRFKQGCNYGAQFPSLRVLIEIL